MVSFPLCSQGSPSETMDEGQVRVITPALNCIFCSAQRTALSEMNPSQPPPRHSTITLPLPP